MSEAMALRLFAMHILFLLMGARGCRGQQLSVDFYARTCPQVESIVKRVVTLKQQQSVITAAGTLRLFFHDCFVDGCDGSVLISSTKSVKAERDAAPNLSLAGDAFDTVVKAKQAVEAVCPGVVSCADILAIAARDATVLANGPSWVVKKGRRDGRISMASRALVNLPSPDSNVNQLLSSFTSKGLNLQDLVVLSGAHTLGHAHCSSFQNRLSNSTSSLSGLNTNYRAELQHTCPPGNAGNPNVVQQFDHTPFTFDAVYFQDLVDRRGLLFSDAVLFADPSTRQWVRQFSHRPGLFFNAFAASMDKMGSIGVLTGTQGEIRKDCTKFN